MLKSSDHVLGVYFPLGGTYYRMRGLVAKLVGKVLTSVDGFMSGLLPGQQCFRCRRCLQVAGGVSPAN